MKLKKFFTHKPNDPMGALNDLSFLLIIYFLVIAGFNTNLGFLVSLPSKDKPRVVQMDDLVRLKLDPQGALFFNDSEITDDELTDLLKENLRLHPNMTVALSMDPLVPYQRFVDTLFRIRNQNIVNFSFSMASP